MCDCLNKYKTELFKNKAAALKEREADWLEGNFPNVTINECEQLAIPFTFRYRKVDDRYSVALKSTTETVHLKANYCPFCGKKQEL